MGVCARIVPKWELVPKWEFGVDGEFCRGIVWDVGNCSFKMGMCGFKGRGDELVLGVAINNIDWQFEFGI